MTVRRPVVSGTFYPDDPVLLDRELRELLHDAAKPAGVDDVVPPRALVAPHAGYVYSGPVAGSAYRLLEGTDHFRRVVLLGPSHRVPFLGLALAKADAFATPLGEIPVDFALARRALSLRCVHVMDEAHAFEHSLEVHLPFIQHLLPAASVLPLVVGDATPGEVEMVIEAVAQDADTLIVVSTDLSHYLDYEHARAADRRTTEAIESRSATLQPEQACGCRPLNGLLRFAAAQRLRVRTLDVRNSGDTAGSRDRVVGYGAYALH